MAMSPGQAATVDAAFRSPNYRAITAKADMAPVTMTGKDLTIEALLRVAQDGAPVALSAEARERSADAYGLLLQGAAEGVTIYWFNRGTGDQRETSIFSGDPTTAENDAIVRQRQAAFFTEPAVTYGPEVDSEELVRAIMAIRVNSMSYEAASPSLTQMLIDLLNRRITPVINSRGTVGEGDLSIMHEIGMVMVGKGEAYYQGKRMSGADALRRAGLKPLVPLGADDSALISTNAVAIARTALLVATVRAMLDWADISTAMAMLGMNSSVTPLSTPVQSARPYLWLNWDAARVLAMLRGSYLLDADPNRIIQDPESLRASPQRIGSAWQAWARLRDTVLLAMNSSDHNPAVRVGARPTDSWELSTPEMLRFHVKGGPLSHGKSGYILSNANWDPYPMANDIEALTLALGNAGVVFNQRIDRFKSPFFTAVRPQDILDTDAQRRHLTVGDYLASDLAIELNGLLMPVTPQGQAIASGVEDLQAATRQKLDRAEKAVDLTGRLIALDLMTSASWLDVRRAQQRGRSFGPVVEAVRRALRTDAQGGEMGVPALDTGEKINAFIEANPASRFLTEATMPPTPQ